MKNKHQILYFSFAIIILLITVSCSPSSGSSKKDVEEEIEVIELDEPGATNPENAFKNILNNKNWTFINKKAITQKNGVYTFNGRESTGSIKRTIVLNQQTTLKYSILVFLYEQYDGCFEFLIDDKVVKTYTGLNNAWQNEAFEIEAGTHTIEWRRNDTNPDYSLWKNDKSKMVYVSLKDFSLKQITALTAVNQTFEDALDYDMWICSGLCTEVVTEKGRWPQSGDALVDTHGKIIKLGIVKFFPDNTEQHDNSSLKIYKISVAGQAVLSFDYKCDIVAGFDEANNYEYAQTFKVFVDDETTPRFEVKGEVMQWKNASIVLSAGIHSVTFVADKDERWYRNPNKANAVYLDNITLASDTIASVDIYPKGLQETYVGGFPIQFSAKALRSDGSVISGKNITWSATGGTIDNDGEFTPGNAEGTYTVTATIDGISGSNQTVKIHGVDYVKDPVTINGHTFTGEITDGTGYLNDTANISFAEPTPRYSHFTADGFFPLKGTASDTDAFVRVIKCDKTQDEITIEEIKNNKSLGEDVDYDNFDYSQLNLRSWYNWDYKYQTIHFIRKGDFSQRIWLRFGDGEYEIWIYEGNINKQEDYDGYEGAYYGFWSSDGVDTTEVFSVINKTGLDWSPDDCAYLMPSYICQSDNYLVSNGFNAVMAELPQNAPIGQKLQGLYDWVIDLCHYDFISSGLPPEYEGGLRKRQDAMHVVEYKMAVCEGYANLYTALARLAGVKSAYQSSAYLNHAWTECYYKGEWKMVDVTWDDPSDTDVTVSIPNAGNYTYFLIDPKDKSHGDKNGNLDNVTDFSRSVVSAGKDAESEYKPDCRF